VSAFSKASENRVTVDKAPEDFTDKMPPQEERLKQSLLGKKVVSTTIYWQERDVALTSKMLCFAKPGSENLLDSIPLHEVSEVFIGDFEDRQEGHHKHAGAESDRITFTIATIEGGHNSGRPFTLSSSTKEDRSDWVAKLQKYSKEAKQLVEHEQMLEEKKNKWRYIRNRVRNFHHGPYFQFFIALIILASFATELYGAEVLPEKGTHAYNTLFFLDCLWTTIFALDVSINLFANWLRKFFRDGWNTFDLVVVSDNSSPSFATISQPHRVWLRRSPSASSRFSSSPSPRSLSSASSASSASCVSFATSTLFSASSALSLPPSSLSHLPSSSLWSSPASTRYSPLPSPPSLPAFHLATPLSPQSSISYALV
jgi:hypothetical protein